MISCLFLRYSSVHSFKQYNLSLYDFPSILLIIFCKLYCFFVLLSKHIHVNSFDVVDVALPLLYTKGQFAAFSGMNWREK